MELTIGKSVWSVLNDLLADLTSKGMEIPLKVNRDLRHTRYIIMHYEAFPEEKTHKPHKDYLTELNETLDSLTDFLILQAKCKVGVEYSDAWEERLRRARSGLVKTPTKVKLVSFSPEAYPRRNDLDFVQISFQKPITLREVQDITKKCGVQIKMESEYIIKIIGKKDKVRKALNKVGRLYSKNANGFN